MEEFRSAMDDAVALDIIKTYDATETIEDARTRGSPDLEDLITLLVASEEAGTKTIPPSFTPKTLYGKLLVEQIRHYRYDYSGLMCCENAEPKLLRSLGLYPFASYAPEKQNNEFSTGPLVCIADGSDVVAVQKNIGEPSIYALRTVERLGLVERTFSGSTIHMRPSLMPTDAPVVVADASAYGAFYPLRQAVSVFSGPTKESVMSYTAAGTIRRREFLAFDHDRIVAAAQLALTSTAALTL